MNKIICFLTGGHRYNSADLECKFDDDEGVVRFNNHCEKCGKIYEVSIPKISILRVCGAKMKGGETNETN